MCVCVCLVGRYGMASVHCVMPQVPCYRAGISAGTQCQTKPCNKCVAVVYSLWEKFGCQAISSRKEKAGNDYSKVLNPPGTCGQEMISGWSRSLGVSKAWESRNVVLGKLAGYKSNKGVAQISQEAGQWLGYGGFCCCLAIVTADFTSFFSPDGIRVFCCSCPRAMRELFESRSGSITAPDIQWYPSQACFW